VDDGAVAYNPDTASFADLNAPAAPVFAALIEAEWSEERAALLLVEDHGVDLDSLPTSWTGCATAAC
jgi:hypothetical protein